MRSTTTDTIRIFFNHARLYRWRFFLIFISVIVGVAVGVVTPLVYGKFFDVLTQTEFLASVSKTSALARLLFIVLALNLVSWICWRTVHFSINHLQPRIMADLANTCFEYIHQHSYRFFSNTFVGSLVKKVNRYTRAFEDLSDKVIFDIIPLIVEIGVVLIVLTIRNPVLALILLIWTVIFIVFSYIFSLYKLQYDLKATSQDTRVTAHLADTITNSVTIKLFSGLAREFGAFKHLTEEQFRLTKHTWRLGSVMEAISAFLIIVLEFAMFFAALYFWNRGEFTIGDFAVLQVYVMRLTRKLWDLGRIIRRVYELFADAAEMTEVFLTPHEIKDARGAKPLLITRGEIIFRDVYFEYHKGVQVFGPVKLNIKPQEKVALIGPSGGGKSTFVKLLFRFFDTKNGVILIDRQDIKKTSQESLRAGIALVPQDPVLFHRSLMDNIRYGRSDADDKDVIIASRLAHADEFIVRFPDKYNTLVGERGVKLSGGERQRVAIARAILKNAKILVLDEATSSLDSESERMIQDALAVLMKGKTVIVIAHRLSTIMQMDRIIVLNQGRIDEEGTHGELLQKNGSLYRRLWELQASGFIR